MLNGGSMVWGFCVYFVYMIPLETDVLRKHRFQKQSSGTKIHLNFEVLTFNPRYINTDGRIHLYTEG